MAVPPITMEYDPAHGHRWNCEACGDFGDWMDLESDAVSDGLAHRCTEED